MHQIEQPLPSDEFINAWLAAGNHIHKQAGSGLNWLRINLDPPLAEHLSFRIGNQIFFIFINAAEFDYSAQHELFDRVCKITNCIPCLLPMQKSISSWKPQYAGWGLQHAKTGQLINPLDFVTDELIEMGDWEVHHFAMQHIAKQLKKEGKKVYGQQPSNEIDPSIWFEDEDGAHFVVVRSGRHPLKEVEPPANLLKIKAACSNLSDAGYFAYVVVANSEDPFDPNAEENGNFLPLYRGHGLMAKYSGLIPI